MQGDDDTLAADFVARRADGFERAYRTYARELVAVARNVVGDGAAAEDCVHDALVRVWRTPESYRSERGSLRAFLIACVRNEAMSALRRSVRRESRELRAERLGPPALESFDVANHVEAARVRAALAALPGEQKLVIEQAYFANLTHREIAQRLDLPLGTIKSRISLGMRKLQATLGPRDV